MTEGKKQYKKVLQITITILTVFTFLYSCFYFSIKCSIAVDTNNNTALQSVSTKAKYYTENNKMLPCGFPVGIYLETDGLLVVDTDTVTDISGQQINPTNHLIQSGDYIQNINGKTFDTKEKLVEFLQMNKEQELQITLKRQNEEVVARIQPALAQDHTYKVGMWIRDDSHGIGTLTFIDKSGNFAALGHGISDIDTGELLSSKKGQLYQTQIYAITKGQSGNPGSLTGLIDYSPEYFLGDIYNNTYTGIFGNTQGLLKNYVSQVFLNESFDTIWGKYAMPVADTSEVYSGSAQIISYVSGKLEQYEIEIGKIDFKNNSGKNMVIQVKDERLLELTGGIVRGMSGSPIIQDGKIIGAVTHVFVNDPEQGYGIFAETMLNGM